MLKTTQKVNDVVTVKLVSGEEVMGYYVKDDMMSITLRKPIVPVPTEGGNVGLAPFIMTSDYLREGDGELSFNRATIITVTKTNKAFSDAYIQQVSGIDVSTGTKPGLIS